MLNNYFKQIEEFAYTVVIESTAVDFVQNVAASDLVVSVVW